MLQQTQLPLQRVENTADMYELLPKLVKQLSHLLLGMQRVLIVSQQSPLVFQVEAISMFEQKLSKNLFAKCNHQSYNSISYQNEPALCNLFRRFSCRVMETLITFKQRAETSSVFQILANVIAKVQISVLHLQQNGGFLTFIKQISSSIDEFLIQVKKNIKKNKQTNTTKGNQKTIANPLAQHKIQQNKTDISQTQNQYKIKLRKSLYEINSRFKTIDCMELDYSYFRSSFFKTNNNNENFFQSYLERNEQIASQIMQYAKNYKVFSDRKVKRKTQKNLRHINLAFNSIQQIKGNIQIKYKSIDSKYNPMVKSIKKHAIKEFQLIKNNRFLSKKFSLCQQNNHKSNQCSPNKDFGKTKYQIKNVIISGNSLMAESLVQTYKNNVRSSIYKLQRQNKKTVVEKNSFFRNLKQLSNSIYDNK